MRYVVLVFSLLGVAGTTFFGVVTGISNPDPQGVMKKLEVDGDRAKLTLGLAGALLSPEQVGVLNKELDNIRIRKALPVTFLSAAVVGFFGVLLVLLRSKYLGALLLISAAAGPLLVIWPMFSSERGLRFVVGTVAWTFLMAGVFAPFVGGPPWRVSLSGRQANPCSVSPGGGN